MNRVVRRHPRITVRNLQRKVALNTASLQDFAERALMVLFDHASVNRPQLDRLPEISILVISDPRMSSLHRRFLKTSDPTDVITFHHGEIFISAETARKQARRFKTSTLREIQLYIVHGLLHLIGWEDRTEVGAQRMAVAQQKVLAAATVGGSR